MFPILLGKIKELEDKIKNLTPVDPYDPKTNTIILQRRNGDARAIDMKWKDIYKLFKNGKQIFINPRNYYSSDPDNDDSLCSVTAVYQYAINSFVVIVGNEWIFQADSENDYPSMD